MSATVMYPPQASWPGHLELPWTDGEIVENAGESPQNAMLTDSIEPILRELHPDGRFFIGQDVGIYFRYTDPPLDGCRSPDWYYVPNVDAFAPDGELRRSYVLWKELQTPYIVFENVSGDGEKEHDATPEEGKFWVYEKALQVPYYFIYDGWRRTLEGHRLINGSYVQMKPDAKGRYHIEKLNVYLSLWRGVVGNVTWTWARFFDSDGFMLLTGTERAEKERRRAERLVERVDQFKERADSEKDRADAEKKRAQKAEKQAEAEAKRAESEAKRAQSAESELARLRQLLAQSGIDPKATNEKS